MKLLLTILFSFFLLVPIALAVDSQYCNDTSGAVAVYWMEDETDETTSAYDLTNNGTITFGAGNFNNAADLGSSNSTKSFSRTDSISYAGGDFTISTWVNVQTAPSNTTYELVAVHETTTDTELRLDYRDNAGTKYIDILRTKTSVTTATASNTGDLGTGAWHHLAYTYDIDTGAGIAYLDGSPLGNTITQTGAGSSGCNGLNIGAFMDAGCGVGAAYFSSVYLDETIFNNTTLSAANVGAINDRTNPPIGCPAAPATGGGAFPRILYNE